MFCTATIVIEWGPGAAPNLDLLMERVGSPWKGSGVTPNTLAGKGTRLPVCTINKVFVFVLNLETKKLAVVCL